MVTQDLPQVGDTVEVESASNPGHFYTMIWTPVSGWVHADGSCPARVEFCRHRKEAYVMTSLVPVTDSEGALDLRTPMLLTYDPTAIGKGVDAAVAAKWAYDVTNATGVGIEGAQEGQRLLASMGEVIQVDFCKCESETAETSFWTAGATRWILDPENPERRIFGGNTIVHKEQPKFEKHSAKYMREHPNEPEMYPNPHWRAIGSSKATRNAILDLTPGNVRAAIMKAGLVAQKQLRPGGYRQDERGEAPRQQAPAPQQKAPETPRVVTPEQEARYTDLIRRYTEAGQTGALSQVAQNAAQAWPMAIRESTGRFAFSQLPDTQAVEEFLSMLELGLESEASSGEDDLPVA